MTDVRRGERTGFAALVAFLLAPIIAQGLHRPLAHVFGLPGRAAGRAELVTLAALAACAVTVLVEWLRRGRSPWLLGRLAARLPPALDGLAGRHPRLCALYVLFALLAIVSTARLSIFIGDPARADLQTLPGNAFLETHSCLTAYVRADSLVRRGVDNVYDDRWWHGSHGLPPLPAGVEDPYRPFGLDNFNYPPPFLLIMTPLAPLEGDFFAQRALWFGLNGLLLALGLWIVARAIEGPGAHRALLLAPLLFGSLPVLIVLQVGNFHVAATVLAVLAMLFIDRGRPATGGALLAATILSKISPGLLGVVLLAKRRFRGAAFAAGFGALFLALSVLRSGTNPIKSFLTHALPHLRSGAAFPFIPTESGIVTNMSLFGVPFKLRLLGIEVGDPWQLGRRISSAYTLGLLVLAVLAARRRRGDLRDRAITWMALLVLAALQSPFAPGYVTIGLLWATTLLAVEVRGLRGALSLVALWLLILLVPPWLGAAAKSVQSMAQTIIVIGVCVWLIVRAPVDRRVE